MLVKIAVGTICMTGVYALGRYVAKPIDDNDFKCGYLVGLVASLVGIFIML